VDLLIARQAAQNIDRKQASKQARIRFMLILSREACQQVRVGDNIVLTIKRVSETTVSIGIEAPADVKILRSELPRHRDLLPLVANDHQVSQPVATGEKPSPLAAWLLQRSELHRAA
jgi:carbon storage regulator CsrA